MDATIRPGDCVRIPDGRIGRVREQGEGKFQIRVPRRTSKTKQFLWFTANELQPVDCPTGWMSPEGYNRYLAETLAKMRARREKRGRPGA